MNIFKKLFKKSEKSISDIKIPVTVAKHLDDLKQFDDIWIGVNNNIFEGWVTQRTDNVVEIIYTNNLNQLVETNFTIERPFNRDALTQGNKTLFLNKKATEKQ